MVIFSHNYPKYLPCYWALFNYVHLWLLLSQLLKQLGYFLFQHLAALLSIHDQPIPKFIYLQRFGRLREGTKLNYVFCCHPICSSSSRIEATKEIIKSPIFRNSACLQPPSPSPLPPLVTIHCRDENKMWRRQNKPKEIESSLPHLPSG